MKILVIGAPAMSLRSREGTAEAGCRCARPRAQTRGHVAGRRRGGRRRPPRPCVGGKGVAGVGKLYLLNAVTPDELTQGLIAYDIAKKLEISHVVYHSVFRVERFSRRASLCLEARHREYDQDVRRAVYHHSPELFLPERCLVQGRPHEALPVSESARADRHIRGRHPRHRRSRRHHADLRRTPRQNLQPERPRRPERPKVASIWSELLEKEIKYAGDDLEAFEARMREHAPSWAAFDIRMMFQGYLERGFASGEGDLETLTALLGTRRARTRILRARPCANGKRRRPRTHGPARAVRSALHPHDLVDGRMLRSRLAMIQSDP